MNREKLLELVDSVVGDCILFRREAEEELRKLEVRVREFAGKLCVNKNDIVLFPEDLQEALYEALKRVQRTPGSSGAGGERAGTETHPTFSRLLINYSRRETSTAVSQRVLEVFEKVLDKKINNKEIREKILSLKKPERKTTSFYIDRVILAELEKALSELYAKTGVKIRVNEILEKLMLLAIEIIKETLEELEA